MFDRVGYGQASLSDIAREAGTTQGSLYFYFPSKEELALAVINEQETRLLAAFSSDTEAASPLGELVRSTRALAELLLTDAIVRAGLRLSLEQGVLSVPTGAFLERSIDAVERRFRASVEIGESHAPTGIDALARSFMAYLLGTQLLSNVLDGRAGLLEGIDAMWRVIIVGTVVPEHQPEALRLLESTFTIHDTGGHNRG